MQTETKQQVRLVVDDLKAVLELRNELRRLLFTAADWIPSFEKTDHKTFTGRALYQLALAIDALETRIAQLTMNAEMNRLNQPSAELYEDAFFEKAAERKRFLTEKTNEALRYIEAYLPFCEGVRDEPSVLAMQAVRSHLTSMLEALERHHAKTPFDAETVLVRAEQPARESGYQVVPMREARLAVSEEERMVSAVHFIAIVIEVAAIEICSTLIVENREMPWPFYLDVTRQCYDEARHYEILHEKTLELGGYPGKYPIHIGIWEFARRGRNLAEKLAIQQVVQEGHGIDANIINVNSFLSHEEREYAAMFDYINVDEADHVRIGCRWLLHECGGDRDKALEVVHSTYEELMEMGFKPGFEVQEEERLWVGMSREQVAKAKEAVVQVLQERQAASAASK